MKSLSDKPRGRNGGYREGSGRKPFEPTDKERLQVEKMSGFGVPVNHIAVMVRDGITQETLLKHFRKELDIGKAKANTKVGQTLFQQAMAGNTAAAIWWSKSQMGWRDQSRIDITSNGKTIGGADAVMIAIKRFNEANEAGEGIDMDDSEFEAK